MPKSGQPGQIRTFGHQRFVAPVLLPLVPVLASRTSQARSPHISAVKATLGPSSLSFPSSHPLGFPVCTVISISPPAQSDKYFPSIVSVLSSLPGALQGGRSHLRVDRPFHEAREDLH